MGIVARVTFGFLAAAASVQPASAELRQFRDWLAVCDNVRTCTAYAMRELAGGVYLRLDRDAAADAPPRFTILVQVEEGTRFTLAFDDATPGGLPQGPITAKLTNDLARVEITPEANAAFIAALRKANKIIVSYAEPKNPDDKLIGEISLSGATASMLWIDEQQRRLLNVTALVRIGSLPARAVPQPPALPIVHRATPDAAPADKTFPPAVLAKGRALCGTDDANPEPGEINALSDGLLAYWFECRAMSGAYNAWSGLVVAPRDKPQAAQAVQLPSPPGELAVAGMPRNLIVNAGFDEKTLTLTMFAKGRGPGDCGSAGEWVFDGKDFRLTRYQSMPLCAGLISENWPVLYRAKVE